MEWAERYGDPEMLEIWGEENKVTTWVAVEIAAASAQGAPEGVLNLMTEEEVPDPQVLAAWERRTQHDVVAFLRAWTSGMPEEAAKWVHKNMTSSDLVDTANAVRIKRSMELVLHALRTLVRTTAKHALANQYTTRVARTHGQHAEVSSWGYWMANLALALVRAEERLRVATKEATVAKLSGPVGDFKRIGQRAEKQLAETLGLNTRAANTQVVMRDGYADLVFACAQVVGVVEALALEVRLCQQTEINELAEGKGRGYTGSSAMPHKQNPVTSEKLCGLAKVVRSGVTPVMEGVALWHERDISHSSVERVVLPQTLILTHHALLEAAKMVRLLVVKKAKMNQNIRATRGLVYSAAAKEWLIEQGLSDPHLAWDLVQEAAQEVREDETGNATLANRLPVVVRRAVAANRLEGLPPFTPNWAKLDDVMKPRVGNTEAVFDLLELLV